MQELKMMRRSTFTLGLLGTLVLGLSSCVPPNQPEVQTLYVAPNKGLCKGLPPEPVAFLLTRERPDQTWSCFGDISGFAYEPGFLYKLNVEVKRVAIPLADAPDRTYTLLNIIEKTASTTLAAPGQP